ncbi:hypothetical protein ElyMa_006204700 [Elysia marginata]|uniref:Helitron helicase-like domain-containing protein n=1 Tax=Elysia marginata TaxID=1093978 RepID=A0AAV4H4G1_9GAST|nr:hypothetical protein ElyMa_006204700 [Elysia marginata]
MHALKNGCLDSVDAWLYNIEFQKRGFPHAHILLWMPRDSKIHPCMIDAAVSAEIPDKNQDPELFKIVTSHMVHGPCGALNPNAPCLKDGKCSKQFPKPFVKDMEMGTDSYPKYQCRVEAIVL